MVATCPTHSETSTIPMDAGLKVLVQAPLVSKQLKKCLEREGIEYEWIPLAYPWIQFESTPQVVEFLQMSNPGMFFDILA